MTLRETNQEGGVYSTTRKIGILVKSFLTRQKLKQFPLLNFPRISCHIFIFLITKIKKKQILNAKHFWVEPVCKSEKEEER